MRQLIAILIGLALTASAHAADSYVLHFDIPDKPLLTEYGNLAQPSPPNTVNECSRLRLVFRSPVISSIDDVLEVRLLDDDGDWVSVRDRESGLRDLRFVVSQLSWAPNLGRLSFRFWRFEYDTEERRTFYVYPNLTDAGNGSYTINFDAPATAEFKIRTCDVYFEGDTEVYDCDTVDFPMQQIFADRNGKDIDGDGNPDLFWRNQADGRTIFNRMDGLQKLNSLSTDFHVATPQWKAIGIGDFDGDRYADVLWRKSDGDLVIYFMQGRNRIGTGTVNFSPTDSWEVRAIADFNHDGRSDIYMWNKVIGSHRIHHMDGAYRIGIGAQPNYRIQNTNWQPIGAGDFNGDGNTDLMYQNVVTGRHNAHFLDTDYSRIGNHATGAPLPDGSSSQQDIGPFAEGDDLTVIDAGVADTNSDGIADVISRSRGTGRVFFHQLLGGAEPLSVPSPSPFALGQLDWELRVR